MGDFIFVEDLSSVQRGERVFVITGCSKSKIVSDVPVRAKDLYTGQVFRFVKRYCEVMGFPLGIISAKYGFILEDDLISGYEKVLGSMGDVECIRSQVESEVGRVAGSYDKVVVIAGKYYREALRNVAGEKFIFLKARGIGYLLGVLKREVERESAGILE